MFQPKQSSTDRYWTGTYPLPSSPATSAIAAADDDVHALPSYTMTSQFVTMSDGTRLAMDLYLPPKATVRMKATDKEVGPHVDEDDDGRTQASAVAAVPCILHQSRYHRSISLRWPFRCLVNRGRPFSLLNTKYFHRMLAEGFAVVSIDMRGTGASFGTNHYPW